MRLPIKMTESMYETIRDIVIWIDSDLSRPMTVEIVANRAGYSQWHLLRAFKHVTGYTVIQYTRLRRMTVAAELLKSTNLHVSEIYMQVGYEDGPTFCRPFRAHFGVSPLELRGSSNDFVSRMVAPLMLD